MFTFSRPLIGGVALLIGVGSAWADVCSLALSNRNPQVARAPRGTGAPSLAPVTTPGASPLRAADPFILEVDAAYTMAFGDQWYGEAVAGPGEYFAVWVDLRSGGANPAGYDLYGQRILPDGSVAAPGSLELLRAAGRMTTGVPAVGWNGNVYLVAWHEGTTLWALRVAADGQVLDPGGFVVGTHSGALAWPAIASDGMNFLIVQASGNSIHGYRVSGDGVVLDPAPILLSAGASGLGYPKLAFAAGVYVVAWAQAPPQMIRAARVTPGGQVLEPGGVNVSGGGTDVDAFVDFDGDNFFIAWSRQDSSGWDVWGARVSPQMQIISGPALVLNGNPWALEFAGPISFNGSDHLIALTTGEPIYSNTDLYAVRVNSQGNAIGSPFPVSTIPAESEVAFGAGALVGQFFISSQRAWVRGVYYVYDVEGARIDAGGNLLDDPPIAVSTCAAWQIASAASFDGENFLCIFEDWREGKPGYQPDLYAVRVTRQGQALDTSAFRIAGGVGRPEQQPDATFGGGQHVVVHEKNVGTVNEVRMVRVLPDGTVLDPNGILVFANEPTAETLRPKVAWNGQRYCVIWYDNYLFQGQEPLQFALVRTDGTIAYGPANIPSSDWASFNGFALSSNGDEFLVAWMDYDRIRATRISNTGAVLGTQTIQLTGNWITEQPKVAFNGTSYLVAWSQWTDMGVRVYARRLSQSGAPVGNLIAVVGPHPGAVPIEVFPLDTDFYVIGTYRSAGPLELFSARFDANGVPIGAPEVLMSLPWDETYAGSSAALAPGGTLLTIHSLWAANPYNTPRAQGQLFHLGDLRPGDLNCDGLVNFDDINPFVLALSDPAAYAAEYPACDILHADCNGDGLVDFDDISAFVALLGGY